MSGFAASWLDLREPADHEARDGGLLDVAAEALERVSRPSVIDLGCGTGSTVRALSPRLSAPARWHLVDNDPALLREARSRLAGEDVVCIEADLGDVSAIDFAAADLVTASALFDLVSRDWLERLAASLQHRRIPVYAALNFDGRIDFTRPHPLDAAVVEAFLSHQAGDKGFGPALGPHSPDALDEVFSNAGYRLRSADSPWRLKDDALGREFVDGVAQAARETGRLSEGDLDTWRTARRDSAACLVGHRDILALPQS